MRSNVRREDICRGTEDVRRAGRESKTPSPAAPPIPTRRHGRPPDVVVVVKARSPHDPSRRVDPTGYPSPASPADPGPAAVVKRCPPPAEVTDPEPGIVGAEPPVPVADVRREIAADDGAARQPHNAVSRILLPRSVRGQRVAKIVERGGIGVGRVIVFRRGRRLARRPRRGCRGGLRGWRRGWRGGLDRRRCARKRGELGGRDGRRRRLLGHRSTRLGGDDLLGRRAFGGRLVLTRRFGLFFRPHLCRRSHQHEHGRSQSRRAASLHKHRHNS